MPRGEDDMVVTGIIKGDIMLHAMLRKEYIMGTIIVRHGIADRHTEAIIIARQDTEGSYALLWCR